MKLITKFILIYLVITCIVLSIGGVISYYIIEDEINRELRWQFMDRIERVTYLLEERKLRVRDEREGLRSDENIYIRKLDEYREDDVIVSDTLVWDEGLQRDEPNLKVAAIRNINRDTYYISTYDNLVESEDITEAVLKTLLWILGMQVLGAIGVGFVVSSRLFKPFRVTLKKLQKFSIQEGEPIKAEKTSVNEFNDLNNFVEDMTSKAIADYQNLKEFAENASHEIQTPLSVVQGKLELLTETDLNSDQHKLVQDTQRNIKKLSRLSESLGLLSRIKNQEFEHPDKINLTELIERSVDSFSELVSLNNLTIEQSLKEDVSVNMHPALADILWTNLFQNSIKHNIEGGHIIITLTDQKLEISNTGRELTTDPELLFERFRKADQNTESIGLGLSIVKQIVKQAGYRIQYTYLDGMHTISLLF
jgi:signal transduction histidine kinase